MAFSTNLPDVAIIQEEVIDRFGVKVQNFGIRIYENSGKFKWVLIIDCVETVANFNYP